MSFNGLPNWPFYKTQFQTIQSIFRKQWNLRWMSFLWCKYSLNSIDVRRTYVLFYYLLIELKLMMAMSLVEELDWELWMSLFWAKWYLTTRIFCMKYNKLLIISDKNILNSEGWALCQGGGGLRFFKGLFYEKDGAWLCMFLYDLKIPCWRLAIKTFLI